MDTFDSPKRPLPWSLRDFQAVLESETEDDDECSPSSFVWPEDPDERTLVPFYLSQSEYTVLANCIDVGRDIAYSDDAIKVWELWTRNMRCEVPLCDLIAQAILTCEDVQAAIATAIATSPAIQDSIVDMLRENEEFTDFITSQVGKLTTEQITGELMGGDCDNSVVAGRVVAIVDRLDTNNVDFFEIIEVGTNDEERVSAVIAAIPGLSEAPVDEIIDILQSLLEDLAENYAAAITEEWKDDVQEDLYCLAKESETCSLTYQQLFEYFRDRAGADLTIGSLIGNVIQYVINGDFGTDELVASGMYTIQLGFILTGREFAGMNLPRIGAITRDAGTSTKWEDWDDCIPEPRIVIVNGSTPQFPDQTQTFIGYDGDWDVWDILATAFSAPPQSMSNGETYTIGVNFARSGGGGFDCEDVSGLDWQRSYTYATTFVEAAHWGAQPYLQCGGFATALGMIRIRVKAYP